MLVQRVLMPVGGRGSWTLLGDDSEVVEPAERYLACLAAIERSPNTVRAYAISLKLWFEFLQRTAASWDEASVEDVARFVGWLRAPAGQHGQDDRATNPAENALKRAGTPNGTVATALELVCPRQPAPSSPLVGLPRIAVEEAGLALVPATSTAATSRQYTASYRDCGGQPAAAVRRARSRHGKLVPMTAMVDLTPAARRLSELVRHIDDDQLSAPTPSDIRVADMLDHVGGLAVAFAAAAAKDLGSATATPPAPDGDRLGTAWRTEIPRALTALGKAWTDPAAWEGMTQVGGVTLPGEIAGQVALDEVVLHAWDLARGTGQPYQQDPATLEACLAAMTAMYPPDNLDTRKGIFGPPIPVVDDAPLVDKVVAYSGRDPGWPGR